MVACCKEGRRLCKVQTGMPVALISDFHRSFAAGATIRRRRERLCNVRRMCGLERTRPSPGEIVCLGLAKDGSVVDFNNFHNYSGISRDRQVNVEYVSA